MSPEGGGRPDGELAAAIDEYFGGFDGFQKQFNAAANGIQGSGWSVLVFDILGRRLNINQLYDQQGNLPAGQIPLLQLDMWVLKAHKARVLIITMDNGKEFYQHTKIAKSLKAGTYFCRPYHSWEKGLNENTNGLIRQYFPKQTDFRNISEREIRRVQDELNHRPRKTLGYETPSVLFLNLFQPLLP